MTLYASGTEVPVARSRTEIEATIVRYGATRFVAATETGRAVILFEAHGRRVMFELPLPDKDDDAFKNQRGSYRYGRKRGVFNAEKWEQACRQRWRALNLVIKAKLEAVESGITTFEDEFLAHIVLPDGKTVGRWFGPQLAAAYDNGKMPPLLPAGGL